MPFPLHHRHSQMVSSHFVMCSYSSRWKGSEFPPLPPMTAVLCCVSTCAHVPGLVTRKSASPSCTLHHICLIHVHRQHLWFLKRKQGKTGEKPQRLYLNCSFTVTSPGCQHSPLSYRTGAMLHWFFQTTPTAPRGAVGTQSSLTMAPISGSHTKVNDTSLLCTRPSGRRCSPQPSDRTLL